LSAGEGLLAIGNTFELVKNPDSDLKSESHTLFTTINNNKQASEKLIKKVVYHMHSTMKKSKITTTQHPYLASLPHGPFIVKVEIIF
jgi:transcription initiation factor IIF auxiliary subunit